MLPMVQITRCHPYTFKIGIVLGAWSFVLAYRVCLLIDGSARIHALRAAPVPSVFTQRLNNSDARAYHLAAQAIPALQMSIDICSP